MGNSAKYQIFISSTYEDLKTERDQVIRAVLEMGHIPVGMEMFSAADDEQWQIIARHIQESDYYVVVVAHRLGSLASEGLSYTRKEYEYARSLGVPCLGFLIADGVSWPADQIETSTGRSKALEEFKGLIRQKPVDFWSNADDLHAKVSIALMKAFTAYPREGWVRASSASAPPEMTAELARLSAENAELRKGLDEAEKESASAQRQRVRETFQTLDETKRSPSYRYTSYGEWHADREVTLFEIFLHLGPEMVIEGSVQGLANTLAMHLRTDTSQPWDVVAVNQLKEILADFMTLDLVRPSMLKHSVNDTNEYWSLAPHGLEVLKAVRKVTLGKPRQSAPPEGGHDDSVTSSDSAPSASRPAYESAWSSGEDSSNESEASEILATE